MNADRSAIRRKRCYGEEEDELNFDFAIQKSDLWFEFLQSFVPVGLQVSKVAVKRLLLFEIDGPLSWMCVFYDFLLAAVNRRGRHFDRLERVGGQATPSSGRSVVL